MTKKKSVLLVVCAVLLVPVAWSSGTRESTDTFNWRVGGGHAPASFETQATERFVNLARERSDGRLNFTLFPAHQLGDSMALMEMLSAGEIEVVANVASWHTRLVPEWEILIFPYAVRDPDHLRSIHQSSWFKEVEEKYAREHNIRIIANNGFRLPRQLLHRTSAMTTPEHIAGERLRKADQRIYVDPWSDFGADVTIVPWGETAVALQSGMVSAMGAPANTIFPQKFYEGAPHVTLTNHQRDTLDLFMSAQHWERLSPELQSILTSAGEDALSWYADQMDEIWADHRSKLEAEGVVFHEPDIRRWRSTALQVAREWEARGEWEAGLFEKIQSY